MSERQYIFDQRPGLHTRSLCIAALLRSHTRYSASRITSITFLSSTYSRHLPAGTFTTASRDGSQCYHASSGRSQVRTDVPPFARPCRHIFHRHEEEDYLLFGYVHVPIPMRGIRQPLSMINGGPFRRRSPFRTPQILCRASSECDLLTLFSPYRFRWVR